MLACRLVTRHKAGHAKNKPQTNTRQVHAPATTVQSDSQLSGAGIGKRARRSRGLQFCQNKAKFVLQLNSLSSKSLLISGNWSIEDKL